MILYALFLTAKQLTLGFLYIVEHVPHKIIDCFISKVCEERQLAEFHLSILEFCPSNDVDDDTSSRVWEAHVGGGSICPFQRLGLSSHSRQKLSELVCDREIIRSCPNFAH